MTLSVEDMQKRLARELSLPARLGHTALLVVSASVAALIGSLWLTEPSLPLRTHIAFGAIVAIGLAWTAFAWWVLANRRVMLANQSVIATRMALGFTALLLIGAVILRSRLGTGAIVMGAALFAVASVNALVAHRRFARLVEMRRSLERKALERGEESR
jgi:hypothetical protein